MLNECRVELSSALTQIEAAGLLGIATRTLRRWDRENFGPPATRIGRSVVYDRAAVEAFARGVR